MNPVQFERLRRFTGLAATVLFVLAALAVIDGFQSKVREPFNTFPATPGQSIQLNGPMPPKAALVSELRAVGEHSQLRVEFERVYTGFWLGGDMWSALAHVDSSATPGTRRIVIEGQESAPQSPLTTFTIQVYPTGDELRAAALALSVRLLGASPFALAAGLAGAGLLFVGVTFLFGLVIEHSLARAGMAEIYMVQKTQAGFQVAFGLGTKDGVHPGMQLPVLSEDGLPIGLASVVKASDKDAEALFTGSLVELGCKVVLAPQTSPLDERS